MIRIFLILGFLLLAVGSALLGWNLAGQKVEQVKQEVANVWPSVITSSSPEVSVSPTFRPSSSANAKNQIKTLVTFYGFNDNDPAGTDIAYPHHSNSATLHDHASGVGTYDDPVTFASDPTEWTAGTKLYVPYLKKYIIMEDWCEKCVSDWEKKKLHLDIWMESNGEFKSKLIACENHWTRESAIIIKDPAKNLPVDTLPLFDPETGHCR